MHAIGGLFNYKQDIRTQLIILGLYKSKYINENN